MAQHPVLKSIRPINQLSFGPNTEDIELRPLNILIGPNGGGKSNLIEILGLLSKLPDKDPWKFVTQAGGVDEWIWKGVLKPNTATAVPPSIQIAYQPADTTAPHNYKIEFTKNQSTYSFDVRSENIWVDVPQDHRRVAYVNRPSDSPDSAFIYVGTSEMSKAKALNIKLSLLAQLVDPFNYQELFYLGQKLAKTVLYCDWVFGRGSEIREPQPVGFDSYRLAGDSINLAQVLKAWRDRGDQAVFDRLIELMRTFYEPVKDVDTELLGTHLRLMVKEDGLSSRTPATRLSDGTLRWLMLLIILLDPAPPPVICIDEPELGLHPDILPTLADLLRDASTRTQLILTTHSRTLVECFSDDPESVCVCEKFDGATEIKRLEADRMKVWLDKYSLGQLWSSGEIGGNRW